ncbi:hypothetical protein [Cellulomonas pakistanensis]|uniref:DUF2530 domain-containing protein n=1 Tax=Cellulomonas pakistanensis TaxID=992287 RepID=A0A919PBJ5_9CELL|nr:hypothetical protein [Cellulomonas pakistanensis]GIG36646.1 hypothetical protein Cpa01nite_20270 [Cellulomonas pakistanensis]
MAPRPDPSPSPDGDEPDGPRADRPRDPSGDRVTDEQWAAIVADLRGDADPTGPTDPPAAAAAGQDDPRTSSGPAVTYPVAPWVADRRVVRPARGDGAGGPGADDAGAPRAPGPPAAPGAPSSGRDWDATAQMDEAERRVDADEHFRPPDPGPVLGGDPLLTMAWLAVALMPVVWLVVLIFWRDAPPVVMQASVVTFVLGLVVLLWRMPHRRDPDRDDSDGAVV